MTGPQKAETTSLRDLLLSPTSTSGALMGGTIGAYVGGPIGAIAGVVIGATTGAAYGSMIDLHFGSKASGRERHDASAGPNGSTHT